MILTRHILREHIAPFVYALLVITGIFLVDFVVQIMDSILSKGLDPHVVLELFFLNTAWMLALSVPMSVLVASLMAFGRMSADREIDAMRAAGVHPIRMLLPGFFTAVALAGGLVWFNNKVLPEANYRAASLREDISRKRPSVMLEPRTMIQEFEGFRIWIQDVDRTTDSLKDITIHQLDAMGGAPTVIVAKAGRMDLVDKGRTWRFSLVQGETHSPDREKPTNYLRIRFQSLLVDVPNVDSRLHRSDKGYRTDREMPIEAMQERIRQSERRESTLVRENGDRIFADLQYIQTLLEVDSSGQEDRQKPLDSSEAMISEMGPAVSYPAWNLSQASAYETKELATLAESRQREVKFAQEQIATEHNEANRYTVEVHKKFSIPMACIVFVLVGAPLGIMARSGGIGTGVAYSLAFFILYWVCLIGGESLADRGKVPGAVAMWFPNAILALIGIFLASRMGYNSQFFQYQWLKSLLRTLRGKKELA